jgi:hypothetical protein
LKKLDFGQAAIVDEIVSFFGYATLYAFGVAGRTIFSRYEKSWLIKECHGDDRLSLTDFW